MSTALVVIFALIFNIQPILSIWRENPEMIETIQDMFKDPQINSIIFENLRELLPVVLDNSIDSTMLISLLQHFELHAHDWFPSFGELRLLGLPVDPVILELIADLGF